MQEPTHPSPMSLCNFKELRSSAKGLTKPLHDIVHWLAQLALIRNPRISGIKSCNPVDLLFHFNTGFGIVKKTRGQNPETWTFSLRITRCTFCVRDELRIIHLCPAILYHKTETCSNLIIIFILGFLDFLHQLSPNLKS